MPDFKVNQRQYSWQTLISEEYTLLSPGYHHPYSPACELLRVVGQEGFDILLRVNRTERTPTIWLGPILVVGNGFPHPDRAVKPGLRIRLRPKITIVKSTELRSAHIERIVSWCTSAHFRAVPCDRYGLPVPAVGDDSVVT